MPRSSKDSFSLLHYLASIILLGASLPTEENLVAFLWGLSILEKYGVVVLLVIIIEDSRYYLDCFFVVARRYWPLEAGWKLLLSGFSDL